MPFLFKWRLSEQTDIPFGEMFRFYPERIKTQRPRTGDWAIFRKKAEKEKTYNAVGAGRIAAIFPETVATSIAIIRDYLGFLVSVPPRTADGALYEEPTHGLRKIRDHHLEQQSIRFLSGQDFDSIVADGFTENPIAIQTQGFEERPPEAQSPLLNSSRPIIEQISNRLWRDSANRKNCIDAYGISCAFTGSVLEFKRGQTLCKACHIWPVWMGGRDMIQNLILLSSDAHDAWDAGQLALSDDYRILRSPRLRDTEVVLAAEYGGYGRVPRDPALRPALTYVRRHRESRFLATRH
ncbi:MAG: HNH endonuclease [Rhizobiaceae bacterium]|nr:HNH endonuclease [Rhizobiaceae bacterium]